MPAYCAKERVSKGIIHVTNIPLKFEKLCMDFHAPSGLILHFGCQYIIPFLFGACLAFIFPVKRTEQKERSGFPVPGCFNSPGLCLLTYRIS
jgi:hypothetical protein